MWLNEKVDWEEPLNYILNLVGENGLRVYLSAGFGGHLERGLEGASLLGGKDGTRSLGSAWIFAIIAAFALASRAFFLFHVYVLILTFVWNTII